LERRPAHAAAQAGTDCAHWRRLVPSGGREPGPGSALAGRCMLWTHTRVSNDAARRSASTRTGQHIAVVADLHASPLELPGGRWTPISERRWIVPRPAHAPGSRVPRWHAVPRQVLTLMARALGRLVRGPGPRRGAPGRTSQSGARSPHSTMHTPLRCAPACFAPFQGDLPSREFHRGLCARTQAVRFAPSPCSPSTTRTRPCAMLLAPDQLWYGDSDLRRMIAN
jgi:hypothetical protein